MTAVAVTNAVALRAALGRRSPLALLVGTVPFAFLGIALGYWAPAEAALPIANLLYLVLAYAGGLWIRPSGLPAAVAAVSPYLPTRALSDALVAAAIGARVDWRAWAALGVFSLRLRRCSRSPATGATRGGGSREPGSSAHACRRLPYTSTALKLWWELFIVLVDPQDPGLLRRLGRLVGDQGRARARAPRAGPTSVNWRLAAAAAERLAGAPGRGTRDRSRGRDRARDARRQARMSGAGL